MTNCKGNWSLQSKNHISIHLAKIFEYLKNSEKILCINSLHLLLVLVLQEYTKKD